MKFFCVPLFNCKTGAVESLDFSQKVLEEVPKEVFKARRFLEDLNLSVNSIENLPAELFRCSRLKKLDLSQNKLKKLPESIGLLNDLMVLNLSNNEIVDLPEQLGQCVNLVSLNISTNMTDLPRSLMSLNQLVSLNISDTAVTHLPTEIDQLVNLQHLDASQCNITSLPDSIVALSKLRVLELFENHITNLPEHMDQMFSLELLDIHSNALVSIPDRMLACSYLNSLDLSQNSLTELPSNIGELTNLTELILCENNLVELPSSIGTLRKLENLRITKNTLNVLTPAIGSCEALKELHLSENTLKALPSSICHLVKLNFLDASKNKLETLPITIGNCQSLTVLNLRHNDIRELPDEIGKLERLKVLDLAFNDLTYLPYTCYVLRSLSALWLSVHQPALPKFTTTQLANKKKVLSCCYLPQRGGNVFQEANEQRSCVGGTRVNFTRLDGEVTMDDEERQYAIGKFERYDTPHPKPFAPKNRVNKAGDAAGNVLDQNINVPAPTESRPLRSVLKKRPVSTYSEVALATTSTVGELYRIQKSPNNSIGWTIVGGMEANSRYSHYKGQTGVFVTRVDPGGAADQAGIQVDDKLLEVDGVTLSNLCHNEVVQLFNETGPRFEVRVERGVEFTEPAEPEFALPELENAPRPPSRNALVLDNEAPATSQSPDADGDFLPPPPQEALKQPPSPAPIPPPARAAVPTPFQYANINAARSLPSLFDQALFDGEAPPPKLPPKRTGSRSHLLDSNVDFDFKGFLNNMVSTKIDFLFRFQKKRAPPPPTTCAQPFSDVVASFQAANPAVVNVEFHERMESPLASSSPVPPRSRIPVKTGQSLPPPLAPKPKLPPAEKPERMDFDSKRRHFEERIREEAASAPGYERPSIPPPKKPVVHNQDLVNQRERASQSNIPMIDAEDNNTSVDQSIQDLLNGNISGISTETIRQQLNNLPKRTAVDDVRAFASPAPSDMSDLSTATADLHQRAADLEKRQALRKANLDSMTPDILRTEEMLRIINNVTPSPIPT